MNLSRRDYIKASAAATAAAAAGIDSAANATNLVTQSDLIGLKWDKAPCRFCGTGCSVMLATKKGRVVASHGDVHSPVNRGLNCVKGYFLSKIMYGEDRLTTPLLRKTNGKFDKNGEFEPVSWDEAFDVMAEKFKKAIREKGPTAVGMFGSGQWTVWEGYAAAKLYKAGFRSNNIDPNARHCMASAVAASCAPSASTSRWAVMTTSKLPMPSCSGARTWPEMHPILWTRVTDRRLSALTCQGGGSLHIRAPLLRARRPADRFHAADRHGDPQLHRQSHHPDPAR